MLDDMENKKVYVTLNDGQDFRLIAKKMTNCGYRMNHATARNILISAMSNFAKGIGKEIGVEMSEDDLELFIKNQDLHNVLADILYVAHNTNTNEQP